MLRRLLAAVLLAAVVPVPAQAEIAHGATFAASGVVAPGLPQNGCWGPQTWHAAGTFVIEPSSSTTYDVLLVGGTDPCATAVTEAGNGVVYGELPGSYAYQRSGATMSLAAVVDLDGHQHTLSCALAWLPSSLNPTTTFNLTGACVLGRSIAVRERVGLVAANAFSAPGLPMTGCVPQWWTAVGTIVTSEVAVRGFTMDAVSSGCASFTADQGTGVFGGGVAGNFAYVRTGPHLSVTGNVDLGGPVYGLSCSLVVVPTSTNPMTSFTIHGTCTFT